MRGFGFGAVAAAAIATTSMLVGQAAADVDPIVIKGSKFFYGGNGTQFYIRGVAYQQEYSGNSTGSSGSSDTDYKDPLADADGCKRDVPVLQELRTNTIRVYAINPEADHKECMQMLSDAGIYVVADLSQPATSIIRNDPAWNDELYARYAAVIDEMAQYNNTLGFFAGNEVSNQPNNTDGIAANATTGDFGAYSMCNTTEQLGWIMDAYYQQQSGQNQASACDFDGSAATKSAVSPSGVCNDLMKEAGSAGTGVVSTKPTATGAGQGANGGSGEGASGSGSSGAGSALFTPQYTSGSWQAVSLLVVGLASGFGMILL